MDPSSLAHIRADVDAVPRTGDERIAAVTRQVDEGEISVEAGIAEMTRELQNLKVEMRTLRTRKRFLSVLASKSASPNPTVGLFPTADEITDLEVELAGEKSRLRNIKEQRSEKEDLLFERAESFASAHAASASARVRVESLLAQCELAGQRARVEEILAGDDALPELPAFLRENRQLHLEPAKLLLNRLDMDIELREEIEAAAKREREILAENRRKEMDVSRVAAELDDVLHDVRAHEQSNPQSLRLKETLQKAEMRLAIQKKISGAEVTVEEGSDVVVHVDMEGLRPEGGAGAGKKGRSIRIGTQKGQMMMATSVEVDDGKGGGRGVTDLEAHGLSTLTPIVATMEMEKLVAGDL